ncbi:unnamed protein product [Sphenostylis stenocarpa]|uniref:Uncharacterized protein n=1 Tax=Sphenostylis stenocarpa TaxID=92480 RepID=A0AA86SF78_9FABA|nr:unnamed protein product [Sphenostylis stenocarpa]
MARLLRNTTLLTRSLFVPKIGKRKKANDRFVCDGHGYEKPFPSLFASSANVSDGCLFCCIISSCFRLQGFELGLFGSAQILSFSSKVPGQDGKISMEQLCNLVVMWLDGKIYSRRRSKSDGSDSGEENVCKKELALQQALDQITSAFGKGSIMWLGRTVAPKNVPVVSTGSFALDIALGIGGLPKGRVVEIYGPEASGKTTLALHVIAEAQKQGGYCVFVDAEHALDKTLAESIGVNTANLLLSQPDCGEQALSLVDTLIRSGSVDVIVVDSDYMFFPDKVAALVPKGELDGEMGDAHMAMQARLMSQALRKLSHAMNSKFLSRSCLFELDTPGIYTNLLPPPPNLSKLVYMYVRSKISTFGGFSGPTEVTCGGNALKFYASVRLNIKRIGFVKKGEEILGSQVLVKVVKNKLAPPFKTAEFELQFGKGICKETEIIDLSVKHKLILKAGAMYYYNEHNFRGKDALKSFLAENHSAIEELETKLREKVLNVETEHTQESDVIKEDVTEEIATVNSTDEETAIIEA